MSERKELAKFTVDTEIYDCELPHKIYSELKENIPQIDSDLYYKLDITFDKKVYSKVEFYQYPLEERVETNSKSKQDTQNELIQSILSEQLNKIVTGIESLGIEIGSAGIIGEQLAEPGIIVSLYEGDKKDYTKSGKPVKHFKSLAIMPDRPALMKKAIPIFAEFIAELMKKEQLAKLNKANHTPNIIKAQSVFNALSKALKSRQADELLSQAAIESDFPLKIKKGTKTEIQNNPIHKDTDLDCPEFMLFHEYTGGFWTFYEVDNLRTAKRIITKEGFNLKSTKDILVFQNQLLIPYTLFKETDEGLIRLDKDSARGCKALNLSWN